MTELKIKNVIILPLHSEGEDDFHQLYTSLASHLPHSSLHLLAWDKGHSNVSELLSANTSYLVYQSVYSMLLEAFYNKKSLQDALSEWRDYALKLVELKKSHKASLNLISDEYLTMTYGAFCDELQIDAKGEFKGKEHATLAKVVCDYTLRSDKAVSKVKTLIEAMSLPVTKQCCYVPTVEEVFAFADSLESELKNFQNQVQQAHVELANKDNELQELDDILVSVNLRLEDARALVNEYERLSKVSSGNLFSLQGRLEESEFNKRKFRRNKEQLEKENDALRRQLKTLQASINNKIEQNETLEKNAALDKKEAISAQKVYSRTVGKLERALKEAKLSLTQANSELTQLNRELASIKESPVWKAHKKLSAAKNKIVRRKSENINDDISLVATSEYFDIDWYLATYPDVEASDMNPIEHYLLHGAKEGRIPSPNFDGNWYLQRYPDVAESDVNPLIHFIRYGQAEGRVASPKLLSNNN